MTSRQHLKKISVIVNHMDALMRNHLNLAIHHHLMNNFQFVLNRMIHLQLLLRLVHF